MNTSQVGVAYLRNITLYNVNSNIEKKKTFYKLYPLNLCEFIIEDQI